MPLSLQLGLFYLLSELLLTVTHRSRSRTGTRQDQSTLGILWLVITASIAAGICVAGYWPSAALPYGQMFAFVGVMLFVAGILLRWWAIVVLGRFFTVDVTIEKYHPQVERGPFRAALTRRGQPVWNRDGLEADAAGAVAVSFPARYLPPGDYEWRA